MDGRLEESDSSQNTSARSSGNSFIIEFKSMIFSISGTSNLSDCSAASTAFKYFFNL